jgi:transcriptional regulator with XRE-family HTH domain
MDRSAGDGGIGFAVRRARHSRGLTLEELAGLVGRSKAWLSMIENGQRPLDKTTYAKSPYRVYEIYGTSVGPGFYHRTWKYGITRQMIPAQRPQPQVKNCTKYFGSKNLLGGSCTYKWIWIGVGWFQARTIEASYTLLYALQNGGNCPPGMPACT